MDFTYVSRQPSAPLRRFVESIWYACGRPREQIAPTGSTVAGMVLGAPVRLITADGAVRETATGFLIGPHDRPVVAEPTGPAHCVGIVAAPVACQAVFGLRPAHVRDLVLDLATVWPPAAALRTELLALSTPDELLDRTEAGLDRTVDYDVPRLERCEQAVAVLTADPTRSVAHVAAELGVSHAYLDREFTRVVGLSPRTWCRIHRLRRLLANMDVYGQAAWTELAASLGWRDEAHLIRDFQRHTGMTPAEYQASV